MSRFFEKFCKIFEKPLEFAKNMWYINVPTVRERAFSRRCRDENSKLMKDFQKTFKNIEIFVDNKGSLWYYGEAVAERRRQEH